MNCRRRIQSEFQLDVVLEVLYSGIHGPRIETHAGAIDIDVQADAEVSPRYTIHTGDFEIRLHKRIGTSIESVGSNVVYIEPGNVPSVGI